MPKQKILIVSSGLRIGGVERSLIGLLDSFDYTRYEVSLFLWRHDGELMNLIPASVRLLPSVNTYARLEIPIKNALLSSTPGIGLARLFAKLVTAFRAKILKTPGFLLPRSVRYCLPFLPSIPGEYDLAISFLTPHDIVTAKASARRKIGWIHTDYSTMECGVDKSFELPMWQKLDAIAAVSKEVKTTFSQVFPEVKDKLTVIENILSAEFVRQQAAEKNVSAEMPAEPGVIRICSVGRFCHPKNFDSVPAIIQLFNRRLHGLTQIEGNNSMQPPAPVSICENLRDLRLKWYLIGYGGDEALIRQKIAEAGVGDQVIILGKKTNPYPYMKACDLYVQPSRYEGKAVTVREAQMLGKPVLITNFPTAKSQLEDNVDGLICPLDNASIAAAIRRLIEDNELRTRLAQTAAARDYSNAGEVEKIYRLMEA